MLSTIPGADGKSVKLVVGEADRESLPASVRAAVGNRPVISLSLTVDGSPVSWSNPGAPVTVTVPYTPTAEELQNPDAIVVWYIDGSGNVVSVPNGRYDPAKGTVTFTTTHFSVYAVAYNPVSFSDVAEGAWYYKPVTFLAARGVTNGTGGGNYSPAAPVKRADFLVMLMRACGIEPDANPADNFADAGDTYYTGYLAAAKRIGLSNGVGNNLFAPEADITRQEMFTILYNMLKVLGRLPEGGAGRALSDFADAGLIAEWAQAALARLVAAGVVEGAGGILNPKGYAQRADMAQILYKALFTA
jgi:hypothetical protein